MKNQAVLDRQLQEFFGKYSYPNDLQPLDDELEQRHLDLYRFFLRCLNLSLEEVTAGRVLDVGCGAGDLAIRRFGRWGANVVCLDLSGESLRLAKGKAVKLSLDRMSFVTATAHVLPFGDGQFDVVHSHGVLHHSGNPVGGFREMVRVCRRGGLLLLGLYSKFGYFPRSLRRAFLRVVAGRDLDRQVALARTVFSAPPSLRQSQDVFWYNECHPIVSTHTYGEVLGWFRQNNIDWMGFYPSLAPGRFWNALLYQLKTSRNPRVQRWARLAPEWYVREGKDNTAFFNRFLVQALMPLTGQSMLHIAGVKR